MSAHIQELIIFIAWFLTLLAGLRNFIMAQLRAHKLSPCLSFVIRDRFLLNRPRDDKISKISSSIQIKLD